jgi:hypothetical protein
MSLDFCEKRIEKILKDSSNIIANFVHAYASSRNDIKYMDRLRMFYILLYTMRVLVEGTIYKNPDVTDDKLSYLIKKMIGRLNPEELHNLIKIMTRVPDSIGSLQEMGAAIPKEFQSFIISLQEKRKT